MLVETPASKPASPLATLDALQQSLHLDAPAASQWADQARAERQAFGTRMIFLDTNFLIAGLVCNSNQDLRLREWLGREEEIRINVIVWAEFLCGPVMSDHIRLASGLFPNPEALLPSDAALAAELYNATGRRRGSLADCLIAATCLRLKAALATNNLSDFQRFAPMGLSLAVS